MPPFDMTLVSQLLAALGGGLLVGIERERSKGSGPGRKPAGVRTFALAALIGAISAMIGTGVLILSALAIAALVLAGYLRSNGEDRGLTSEMALYLVFLLGALSAEQPQVAAALYVVVAIVLAFKQALHHFTRQVLTEAELGDLLLLAASVLIILPLLPDRTVDPFDVLNPRKLWLLVVLVMSINAAGYVALRLLGARRGLLLAGLLGGFVSSAATIGSMGQRARAAPDTRDSAVAAGLMSNVATVIQLVVILAALSVDLLREVAPALAVAAAATALVALLSIGRRPRGAPSISGMPCCLPRSSPLPFCCRRRFAPGSAVGGWSSQPPLPDWPVCMRRPCRSASSMPPRRCRSAKPASPWPPRSPPTRWSSASPRSPPAAWPMRGR